MAFNNSLDNVKKICGIVTESEKDIEKLMRENKYIKSYFEADADRADKIINILNSLKRNAAYAAIEKLDPEIKKDEQYWREFIHKYQFQLLK